jgi:[ribosomal protein S18]-alanine N-acetyltransferase
VNIRLAHHSHSDAIAELSRTQIEYGLSWSWTSDRVKRAIRDPETNVIMATEREDLNSALQGFGIMRYRDDSAHLMLLAVAPQARRQGLGTALLHWLQKVAQNAGITHLSLEVREDNTGGIAFYERHGYHQVRTVAGMYQGLVNGVRLERVTSIALP